MESQVLDGHDFNGGSSRLPEIQPLSSVLTVLPRSIHGPSRHSPITTTLRHLLLPSCTLDDEFMKSADSFSFLSGLRVILFPRLDSAPLCLSFDFLFDYYDPVSTPLSLPLFYHFFFRPFSCVPTSFRSIAYGTSSERD